MSDATMTPQQLKLHLKERTPPSHFFSRDSMSFFGDTMRNYGVRLTIIKTIRGDAVEAFELYRKKPVKHGLQSSSYFDAKTFKRIYPDQTEKE